jgi:hypothetical protein
MKNVTPQYRTNYAVFCPSYNGCYAIPVLIASVADFDCDSKCCVVSVSPTDIGSQKLDANSRAWRLHVTRRAGTADAIQKVQIKLLDYSWYDFWHFRRVFRFNIYVKYLQNDDGTPGVNPHYWIRECVGAAGEFGVTQYYLGDWETDQNWKTKSGLYPPLT